MREHFFTYTEEKAVSFFLVLVLQRYKQVYGKFQFHLKGNPIHSG